MYLLDTNHCTRLLEANPVITERLKELVSIPVGVCAIVQGELLYMAYYSEQKTLNLRKVQIFLEGIKIYPIDSQVADVYGQLKTRIFERFGPKEKAKRRRTKLEQLGFAENDLWIAATAKRHNLVIATEDKDFQRISEADKLQIENWLES